MDVLQLIKTRRSIPRFKPDPVPREVIAAMLEAATWAPNHHLSEPWEFLILEEQARERFAEIRRDFRRTLFGDPDTPEAVKASEKVYRDALETPSIIVVTAFVSPDPVQAEEDFAATFCGIQNMMLVAASLGVGTYVRTGGLVRDPALRAFFDLPLDRRVAAVLYVGYPAIVPERRRTPYEQKTRWLTGASASAPAVVGASSSAAGRQTAAEPDVAIDPVCKMAVEIATAAYTSRHNGRTYYFCATGCKAAFEANPAAYVAENPLD